MAFWVKKSDYFFFNASIISLDVKYTRTASRLEKYLSIRFIGPMDITRQFNVQNLKYLVGAKRRNLRISLRSFPFSLYLVVSFLILFNSRSSSARGNSLRKHNKISVEKTAGGAQDAEWNFLVFSRQKLSRCHPIIRFPLFYALFSA